MKRAVLGITSAALGTLLMAGGAVGQCCGDCNGDGQVAVDEILKVVNRALGDTCTVQSGGQQFPATGQTTCWDTNGNVIACSGTGQDGQIQAGGALAYADNGDGTITDLNTHLMWEKKDQSGSIQDESTLYTWADALSTFIGGLNAGAGFARHTDWRLPNEKELPSIINFQNLAPAASADFNANCAPGCTVMTCSCTQSGLYWSSTTHQVNTFTAWFVDFFDGSPGLSIKSRNCGYVRAVRGGS